jgi:Zn finger protein HypA/HybF involved in hydrogenase expression
MTNPAYDIIIKETDIYLKCLYCNNLIKIYSTPTSSLSINYINIINSLYGLSEYKIKCPKCKEYLC